MSETQDFRNTRQLLDALGFDHAADHDENIRAALRELAKLRSVLILPPPAP